MVIPLQRGLTGAARREGAFLLLGREVALHHKHEGRESDAAGDECGTSRLERAQTLEHLRASQPTRAGCSHHSLHPLVASFASSPCLHVSLLPNSPPSLPHTRVTSFPPFPPTLPPSPILPPPLPLPHVPPSVARSLGPASLSCLPPSPQLSFYSHHLSVSPSSLHLLHPPSIPPREEGSHSR